MTSARTPRSRLALALLLGSPLVLWLALLWTGQRLSPRYEVEADAWVDVDPLSIIRALGEYADWPRWYLPLDGAQSIQIDEGDALGDPELRWQQEGAPMQLTIRSAHPTTGLRYELRGREEGLIRGALMWELHAGRCYLRWIEVGQCDESGWRRWKRFAYARSARQRREAELQALLQGQGWQRGHAPN